MIDLRIGDYRIYTLDDKNIVLSKYTLVKKAHSQEFRRVSRKKAWILLKPESRCKKLYGKGNGISDVLYPNSKGIECCNQSDGGHIGESKAMEGGHTMTLSPWLLAVIGVVALMIILCCACWVAGDDL